MFRIDRNLVNLGAVKTIQPIRIVCSADEGPECGDTIEAGTEGRAPDAAASANAMAQVILSAAEAEAKAKAHDAIKKAESEAGEMVEAMLGSAREEAARILAEARERAEEERLLARQDGYAKGDAEGRRAYDERLEEKKRELSDELAAKTSADDDKLKNVLEELYLERKNAFDGLEAQIVGLAMGIVRKVINPSEESVEGAFEMLIRNALKQLNPEGKIMIRVAPSEYERFFPGGSAVFELSGGLTVTASILRDASLGEGDCVIDAEDETVSAGIDTQLKYIQLAFDRA